MAILRSSERSRQVVMRPCLGVNLAALCSRFLQNETISHQATKNGLRTIELAAAGQRLQTRAQAQKAN
jgi:hypothetical protein